MSDPQTDALHGRRAGRRSSRLSRRRKLLFSLLTFALAYVFVELVAFLLLIGHG